MISSAKAVIITISKLYQTKASAVVVSKHKKVLFCYTYIPGGKRHVIYILNKATVTCLTTGTCNRCLRKAQAQGL